MSDIAYLVSDLHAPSHTFVRREIEALRALGVGVTPYTIRRGASTATAAENLLGRSFITYLTALGWALLTGPRRFVASWLLALRHRVPGLKSLIWSQFHFIEAMLLARLLDRAGASRLHNHFANSGATVGLIAARYSRIPWSLTLHGISETDYPAGPLLAEKLKAASFVACASFFMRAQAMRIVDPLHWGKMAVVRCGIDMRVLPHPEPHIDGAPTRMICVGRLSAEKGHFGLLDALATLASGGAEFHLTLVGEGPMGPAIERRAAELHLLRHIRLTGALSEAETLAEIAAADILILPSLMEGLPVVLIEAMAMRRPVVASRVAGIPELVTDRAEGLLFTPSDWEDLSRKIGVLAAARGDWHNMGNAGRIKVEKEFRVELSAAKMARLFSGEIIS
ncbi:glycosyltransferase involved in cell wall biosynthesis [Sphingopyxis sp. OAS728]|uniref:glycosyltransferase n=1 Tax=Sphingopyxis sp. OAS728 TaxID=2663823 RepID=UPI00178C0ADC|nr:glycosyltransferase [Sphingopyxis sp. OAS728]MBE1526382.1 glycosyltransferase involved in cell wall biosynthesis [Sphingopyxis sp. OAS728]